MSSSGRSSPTASQPGVYTSTPPSMDPLSLIGGIIAIIGGITTAYKAIENIADLPEAFEEVKKNLPLVRKILKDVRDKLENSEVEIPGDQQESVMAILQHCEAKAAALKTIFRELETKCSDDEAATSWAKVRGWYRAALRGNRAYRVETLMDDILKGVQKLAWNQLFDLATSNSMEEIKKAIQKLAEVEPSLDDSEFDNMSFIHAEQHLASHAVGQQNNIQGGAHTFISGCYNISGSHATVTFGKAS